MPTADASTPAPTYGTLASSSRPCTVPSSPYGPCSTGKTTSSAEAGHRRSAAAADRHQRVAAGMRDQMRFARRARQSRGRRAAMTSAADISVGGCDGSVQRPSFSIRIGDGVVALGIEVLEHRGRRGERHLVLARAAAVDDADAEFLHVTAADWTKLNSDCKLVRLMSIAVRLRVTHTDGGARRGVMTTRARRRRDAGVHAGRHAGRGEGRHAPRSRRRSAPRSCSATPIICTCGPATI